MDDNELLHPGEIGFVFRPSTYCRAPRRGASGRSSTLSAGRKREQRAKDALERWS